VDVGRSHLGWPTGSDGGSGGDGYATGRSGDGAAGALECWPRQLEPATTGCPSEMSRGAPLGPVGERPDKSGALERAQHLASTLGNKSSGRQDCGLARAGRPLGRLIILRAPRPRASRTRAERFSAAFAGRQLMTRLEAPNTIDWRRRPVGAGRATTTTIITNT
jgi:hypothetical protein